MSEKLNQFYSFAAKALEFYWGDKETRLPKLIVRAGLALLAAPLWELLLYLAAGEKYSTIIDQYQSQSQIVGFILIALGISLFIWLKQRNPASNKNMPDPIEVVRTEMTKWCDQIRDVLRHIDAHVDSFDFQAFECILNQLRMNHNKDDELFNISETVKSLINRNAPDFTAMQHAIGRIKRLAKNAGTLRNRNLDDFIALVEESTTTLVEIKNPFFYGGTMRNDQIAEAVEKLSNVSRQINVNAEACRD